MIFIELIEKNKYKYYTLYRWKCFQQAARAPIKNIVTAHKKLFSYEKYEKVAKNWIVECSLLFKVFVVSQVRFHN